MGAMLLYDGDCGFCTVTARWMTDRLRTPVAVVPWQSVTDLDALGLSAADLSTAVYWVDVFGRRERGHRAVARLLRLCRWPLPLAGALMATPPLSWLAAGAYRVIARNRHRLPGATAACALPRASSPPPEGGPAPIAPAGR